MSRICMDTFEFHLFFFFTSFGPTDVSHPQCFKIIDVLMLCLFSLLIFFPLFSWKRLPFTFVIVYNEYKCSYMWFLSVNTWSYLCGDMSSYPCHCHVIVMSSSWLIIAMSFFHATGHANDHVIVCHVIVEHPFISWRG